MNGRERRARNADRNREILTAYVLAHHSYRRIAADVGLSAVRVRGIVIREVAEIAAGSSRSALPGPLLAEVHRLIDTDRERWPQPGEHVGPWLCGARTVTVRPATWSARPS